MNTPREKKKSYSYFRKVKVSLIHFETLMKIFANPQQYNVLPLVKALTKMFTFSIEPIFSFVLDLGNFIISHGAIFENFMANEGMWNCS